MRKVFKYEGGGITPYTYNSGFDIGLKEPLNPYHFSYDYYGSSKFPNYKYNIGSSDFRPELYSSVVDGVLKYNKPLSPNWNYETPQLSEPNSQVGVRSEEEEQYNPEETKNQKWGRTLTTIGQGISTAFATPQSGLTQAGDQAYNTATQLVSMASPLFGGIMAGVGAGVDLMRLGGLKTDQVTTADQILDSKLLFPLGLINTLGAKKANKLNTGLDYQYMKADMGAGYGGIMDTLNTAEKYSGKNIGNLFGQRTAANNRINYGNQMLAGLSRIYDQSRVYRDIQGTQSDMAFNKENLRMKGGYQDIYAGRKGMTILPLQIQKVRRIQQKIASKVFTENEVQSFKQGGSFNVIPEGALHARLHHMEGAEDLTKKGIPVVVEKNGGGLEQQAEIELNEIIFRYEVTTELEKLMKENTDNAAIEAGKLLVKEIFENTQDRTGLIESLEEPKEGQEEVVKEHRVFQEGGVLQAEETPQEEIPTLEEFINSKIQERIEAAIQKATTRKSPYMFRNKAWKNCIATATDNFGIPVVLRNSDLEANPEKYGFIRLENDGNIDNLPDGVLIQDFNKPGQPNTPGHTVMLVGRDDEGYPLYSYSSGDNDPKSMHNQVRYNFNSQKINVFKYNGTDREREAWKAEYLANYPEQ